MILDIADLLTPFKVHSDAFILHFYAESIKRALYVAFTEHPKTEPDIFTYSKRLGIKIPQWKKVLYCYVYNY